MPRWCAAKNCREKSTTDSPYTFHTFPKDANLRKKWINATCMKNRNPGPNAVLCGKHFSKTDYIFDFGKTQRLLRKGAVPKVVIYDPSTVVDKVNAIEQPKKNCTKSLKRPSAKLASNLSSGVRSGKILNVFEPIVDIGEDKINEEIKRNFAKRIKGALTSSAILSKPLIATDNNINLSKIDKNCNNVSTKLLSSEALVSEFIRNNYIKKLETKEQCKQDKANTIEILQIDSTSQTDSPPELAKYSNIRKKSENLTPKTSANVGSMCMRRRKDNSQHFGYFKESDFETSESAKKMWMVAKSTIERQQRKLGILRCQRRRLTRKVATLQTAVKQLNEEKLQVERAEEDLSSLPYSVRLLRQIEKCDGGKFTTEIRTFALSLYFYSQRAYKFVRETFDDSLPHPRTLRKWLVAIKKYHNLVDSTESM